MEWFNPFGLVFITVIMIPNIVFAIRCKDGFTISFCHPQVTNFKGKRGHNELFEPLYREMLNIRKEFLKS